MEIRAVGYQPYRDTVALEGGESRMSDIDLDPVEIRMQEVTVEAQRTALLPSEGYARGTFLRAAPTDQNQYLLDGVRIYNPTHFGGVLTTFNGDALNEVDVNRNGLPPSYGGRIGGFLDLSMRSGTRHALSGGAGTGSLGSHLALEGPLGPMTFLFSWRRGYPDPAVPLSRVVRDTRVRSAPQRSLENYSAHLKQPADLRQRVLRDATRTRAERLSPDSS